MIKSTTVQVVVMMVCLAALQRPALALRSAEAECFVMVNKLNGSCQMGDAVRIMGDMGKRNDWEIQLGSAQRGDAGRWVVTDNLFHRDDAGVSGSTPGGVEIKGAPFLTARGFLTISIANTLGPAELLQVNVSGDVGKLTGFDAGGAAQYDRVALKRTLFVSNGDTIVIPLMIANAKEQAALGIHDVLMRINVRLANDPITSTYGTVSFSSDIKNGVLLLDGGEVGRVSDNGDVVLRNIKPGDREISLRDESGKWIRKIVTVQAGRTMLAELNRVVASPANPYQLTFLGTNSMGFAEYRRERDRGVVIQIPAGEFLMGNQQTERQPMEHRVYVSEFLMDKTPVTWGQYKMFARATGTPLPPYEQYWGIHDDHPVVFVTWDEARSYAEWVGGRLPTEAEREKAARGTDGRKFPWGNEEPKPDLGVFRRHWGGIATDPVGIRPLGASPYGLLDVGGNVWEWCADWYDDKYYEVSPARDPKGPDDGRARVVRGGSWDSRPSVLSASCRNFGYRGYREGDFGFRCAMTPANEAAETDPHP